MKTAKKPLISLALLQMFAVSQGHSAILFSDNFNRPDNQDLDASVSGIVNNTGSALGAENTYLHGFDDPSAGEPDDQSSNGGGSRILSNGLQLAQGVGTSNTYLNHNFTNASIIAAGGFSTSVSLTGYSNDSNGHGAGFAVGMSEANASTTGDAIAGTSRMTNGFGGARDGGSVAISDFWVTLRGNGTMSWGGSGTHDGSFAVVNVGSKTGTISANFTLSDFTAGSNVDYEVFYNGASQGTGSFAWSGTNANFIGLDARDAQGVSLDDFSVQTIPEPSTSLLSLGAMILPLLRRRR